MKLNELLIEHLEQKKGDDFYGTIGLIDEHPAFATSAVFWRRLSVVLTKTGKYCGSFVSDHVPIVIISRLQKIPW